MVTCLFFDPSGLSIMGGPLNRKGLEGKRAGTNFQSWTVRQDLWTISKNFRITNSNVYNHSLKAECS